MKISIKTIKGEVFPIEIDPTNTILDLKRKIEGVKNMEISTQKLILKGSNTSDENTLESYGVKEGDFLVVMQTKKLPQSQPQIQPQTQPQTQIPSPLPLIQPKAQPQPQNQAGFEQASASNVVLGDKFNQTVEEICKMGFAKEEAIKALKAAFNNPDRAIDYLINGIPETEPHPHSQGGGLSQPISQPLGGNPLIGGGLPQQTQGGSEAFSHLLNNPQFQMVRNLIRQNPQMLQGILLQLQQSNPDLFTVITQNQEAFTRWLTEGSQGGSSQQQNVIQVTPEEKEAIDRLVGLGFEKQAVIQAYLVCDKNEELAANLLFDQMNQGDFDEVLAGNNDHPTIPVTQLQQPKAEENKEKTENKEKSEGDNKEKGDSKEKDDKGDDDHIFS